MRTCTIDNIKLVTTKREAEKVLSYQELIRKSIPLSYEFKHRLFALYCISKAKINTLAKVKEICEQFNSVPELYGFPTAVKEGKLIIFKDGDIYAIPLEEKVISDICS